MYSSVAGLANRDELVYRVTFIHPQSLTYARWYSCERFPNQLYRIVASGQSSSDFYRSRISDIDFDCLILAYLLATRRIGHLRLVAQNLLDPCHDILRQLGEQLHRAAVVDDLFRLRGA
jgi:hypothetical protein